MSQSKRSAILVISGLFLALASAQAAPLTCEATFNSANASVKIPLVATLDVGGSQNTQYIRYEAESKIARAFIRAIPAASVADMKAGVTFLIVDRERKVEMSFEAKSENESAFAQYSRHDLGEQLEVECRSAK